MVAAVVLAAGAASRFGSPKQRLLLPAVLERLAASPVDETIVVVGAHDVETTVPTVRCPEWEQGPGASLRCGLAALPADAEAALVVLADGPDLSPEAVARVLTAWRETPDEIVAASYRGERGHPVVIPRALFESIPAGGARSLPARLVPCDDLGEPGDVDVPADLPERFAAGQPD
jgi:CTP:molybdopterin cytidylyltransferase MocA